MGVGVNERTERSRAGSLELTSSSVLVGRPPPSATSESLKAESEVAARMEG